MKQLDYDFSRAEKDAAMSSGNRRSDGRSACCDRRSGHVLNRGGCKENVIHYLYPVRTCGDHYGDYESFYHAAHEGEID